MKTVKIFSKNAAYQKFEVLKTNRNKRYKYYEFFVEGVRNINEAIRNGWTIVSFIYCGEKPLSDWAKNILKTVKTEVNYQLTAPLMSEISSKEDTSELLAIVKMRDDDLGQIRFQGAPLIAVFDRASNRGNLGTIIRSCDSFGIDGLILTGHAVDLYDPDVISSSMGSFFNIPVVRVADNQSLYDYFAEVRKTYPDLQVVGTTAHKETRIMDVDYTKPTVFMIGNETEGLSKTLRQACDVLMTIPMSERSSASSFNVGCAATVFFYEAVRQRLK